MFVYRLPAQQSCLHTISADDTDGKVDTLADTLTIFTNRVDGNDSVLINRSVKTTEFSLPISYAQNQDVFS